MTARELRPLGDALGTEALGIDLSKNCVLAQPASNGTLISGSDRKKAKESGMQFGGAMHSPAHRD